MRTPVNSIPLPPLPVEPEVQICKDLLAREYSQRNSKEDICICYTNHNGLTAIRRIAPIDIFFGESIYYPQEGEAWFMRAWCYSKQAERTFLFKNIRCFVKD